MLRFFSILLWSVVLGFCVRIHAQTYGLEFAAFDQQKDFRTGLNLTPRDPLPISQDLELSFQLNFYKRYQIFGYVLRIVLNDTLNIDVQSNYSQDRSKVISVIIGQQIYNFPDWGINQKLTDEWNGFSISFKPSLNKLIFNRNGKENSVPFTFPQSSSMRVCFGAIDSSQFITTDVPPMRIRDVQLKGKNKVIASWPLDESQGNLASEKSGRWNARVVNPRWLLPQYSRWKQNHHFKFHGFVASTVNEENGDVYVLTSDSLIILSTENNTVKSYSFEGHSQVILADSRLIWDKSHHTLYHYCLDARVYSRWDEKSQQWEKLFEQSWENSKSYTQHNGWYADGDSAFYFFGGYGFYKYKNNLFRYNVKDDQFSEITLKGDAIQPRYLAASFYDKHKRKAYLLGGYGSESGDQRINPHVFGNLFSIDLPNGNVHAMGQFNELKDDYCLARSFVLSTDENKLWALCFKRHKFRNCLNLAEGNVKTGKLEFCGDSIPFYFEDTRSGADMYFWQEGKELLAITNYTSNSGDSTSLDVYSIKFPPNNLSFGKIQSNALSIKKIVFWMGVFFIVFLGLWLGVWFFIRSRNNRIKNEVMNPERIPPVTSEFKDDFLPPSINALSFLGSLQIFDRDGVEISTQFSPLLKELFLLVFFRSQQGNGGITSEEMTQILWSDMNVNQARNNRAVNMSKLRPPPPPPAGVLLEKKNGYWQLEIQPNLLRSDYLYVLQVLHNRVLSMDFLPEILSSLKKGSLLNDTHFEWLDKIKSEFTNQVLDMLIEFSKRHTLSNEVSLKIADAMFVHDPLNEDALKIKYNALVAMGRHHLAKSLLEQFRNEFKSLYGEPFSESDLNS